MRRPFSAWPQCAQPLCAPATQGESGDRPGTHWAVQGRKGRLSPVRVQAASHRAHPESRGKFHSPPVEKDLRTRSCVSWSRCKTNSAVDKIPTALHEAESENDAGRKAAFRSSNAAQGTLQAFRPQAPTRSLRTKERLRWFFCISVSSSPLGFQRPLANTWPSGSGQEARAAKSRRQQDLSRSSSLHTATRQHGRACTAASCTFFQPWKRPRWLRVPTALGKAWCTSEAGHTLGTPKGTTLTL